MQLIPAIDLLAGQAVRLRQGKYEEVTVYHHDAPTLARQWSGRVARLHVVDLEGARAGEPVQLELVAAIVAAFGAGVQVGGGLRSLESVARLVAVGVERVVLGTIALEEPELLATIARTYPGRVVVAVDARAGKVATRAWQEQSDVDAVELVQGLAALPIAGVLYTDIERDGMEVGPNVEQTSRLAREGGLPVIASGGVGTLEHLRALAQEPGIVGAIVGRAIHEQRFTIEDAVAATGG